MSFLDKFKSFGSKGKSATQASDDGFKRDLRRARRFFEHAETTANASNYDYSIECYINGLRHDPGNLEQHEALYEVAKRRKVAGGKPAGLAEKMKKLGPSPIDRMLHAEKLWAMNPLDESLAGEAFRAAVEAFEETEEDLGLGDVAFWIGEIWLPMIGQQKKPSAKKYLTAKDLFVRLGRYDKAVEACRKAAALSPGDTKIANELKDLQAEQMMAEKRYGEGKQGDFRKNLKDADQQQAIQQELAIRKDAKTADDIIARRRAEYEEDPSDLNRLLKLVDALLAKESVETEKQAIELLKKAWEETGQYRHRVRIGDIQMRQFNRVLRQIKAKLDQNPNDEELKRKYEAGKAKQLAFELQEYTDRCKNYPTDMGLRFELGKRLFLSGKYDEAIGAFQQAKADPKRRALSHEYLGRCYIEKGYLEEAIDTLAQGIEAHKIPDDRLALELQYLKMDAHTQLAKKNKDLQHATEAQQIASKIFQTDINFRDIRQRMDEIKSLIEELKNGQE